MDPQRKTSHVSLFSILGAILFALLALHAAYSLLMGGISCLTLIFEGRVPSDLLGVLMVFRVITLISSAVALLVSGLMAVAMLLGRKNKFLCVSTAMLVVGQGISLLLSLLSAMLSGILPHVGGVSWMAILQNGLGSLVGLVAPLLLTALVFLTCFSKQEKNVSWVKYVFFLPAAVYLVLGLFGIPTVVSGVQSIIQIFDYAPSVMSVLTTVVNQLLSIAVFYIRFLAYLALGAWVALSPRIKLAPAEEPSEETAEEA